MGRPSHLVASLLLAGLVLGCEREQPTTPQPEPAPAPEVPDAGARGDSAVAQKPSGPPPRLFAKRFVSKIRVAPKKEAFRVGYLRGGAIVNATTAEPVGYDKCRAGWYGLETGGFICSTLDVIPFHGERLPERRALQPDLAAPLPYPYGYSRLKNTPVYRRLPTREEAARYEGFALPGAGPRDAGAPPPAAAPAQAAKPAPVVRGASASGARTAPAVSATGETPTAQASGTPGEGEEEPLDAGVATLASLMGEEDSVLQRRMERGFYVSLDTDMKRDGRRYWRTQANGFIPYKRLLPVKGSDFSGVHLGQQGLALPIGYVLSSKHSAYVLNERGKLRRQGKPGYHYMFPITGETEIKGQAYYVAPDGRHYRASDATKISGREKPKEVGEAEKWLDIDLATQSLVAYVGSTPLFATLVSTGRVKDPDNPLKDFRTPTGKFRITAKHLSATMDGDHAIDGPYSIEDVPYVMYFQLAYALHSAFWHNTFGRPRSHGCINLAPLDARWIFEWTTPELPVPWHGVYPKEESEGTRLYIHGETPEG